MYRTVAVVDYGMGNLHSVAKALDAAKALNAAKALSAAKALNAAISPERADTAIQVRVGHTAADLDQADRVIFPGVGALRDCMAALAQRGLLDAVKRCALNKPFLGICLGMQGLMEFSEENNGTPGLGLVKGGVKRFAWRDASQASLKIPHMGWNEVDQVGAHPLWSGIPNHARFYFVHSYYVAPADDSLVVGRTRYGLPFAAAIARDNLFAVQFHPEKSQQYGLRLLANFLAWDGRS